MEKEIKNSKKSTVFLVVITILGIVGYFLTDFNEVSQSLKEEVAFINQDKECDLRESSCKISLQDGTEFILDIEPKSIPLMEDLKFTLKSSNKDLKNLEINLYSTSMNMGELYLPIKNLGNGNYEAKGKLAACLADSMKWNADIKIPKKDGNIGARFNFVTFR